MPSPQYCTVRFQRVMNSCASLIDTEVGSVVARSWVVSAELIVPPLVEFWASVKKSVIHCWSVADLIGIKPVGVAAKQEVFGGGDRAEPLVDRLQKVDVTGDAQARRLGGRRGEDARQVIFHLVKRGDSRNHLIGLGSGIAIVTTLAVDQPQVAKRCREEREWGSVGGQGAAPASACAVPVTAGVVLIGGSPALPAAPSPCWSS